MSKELTNRKTFLQLLFRLLFLVAPTVFVGCLALNGLNLFYSELDTGVGQQCLYFSIGLTAAFILYFFRARFIVTFLILWLVYWILERSISKMPGEFDVFARVVTFKLYATIFIFGWIFGFLLARIKYAYVFISAILTSVTITVISQTDNLHFDFFFDKLFPVLAYALYMMFIAPPLADSIDLNFKKSAKNLGRAALFLGLILLCFYAVHQYYYKDLMDTENLIAEQGGKGKGDGGDEDGGTKGYNQKDGLLERGNKDGDGNGGKGGKDPKDGKGGNKPDDGEDGFKLKDTMKMSDKMSQADYVMFCAKLKNYFPDGSPKPLYFVYHYLTKYDPQKESFIRDTAMPYFDELNVDPSSLALYRSRTDSTVIKNTLATKFMKSVESTVYVSSNTWKHALLAPASAYYCQTIPVDSGYKKMFRSAYRTKSYTSELNNAYFVYNPSANPQLADIQEQRFEELRSVEDYKGANKKLYQYYTQMPTGPLYDSINALALRITKDAKTPIDKVIAIRDFFLEKDKEGNRIFRYTLNPGSANDPNIPSASMLNTFIFKTHAGYCTYYAGASLFLLRSIGIPSRFTTGFATIDRSDKNKGWYWFYASQAHAWTQIYFPGYGWLDFDMTIGNEDQKDAPRPDGTPPLPPPEPWLVLDGKAESAPNLKTKQLEVSFNKIIYFNEDYRLEKIVTRTVDASVCRVLYGKKDTTLSCIRPGDSLIVVSYDDAAKVVPQPRPGMAIDDQVASFPKPIIADEIHIKLREEDRKKEEEKEKQKKQEEKAVSPSHVLLILVISLAGIIVLLFLSPLIWLWLLLLRLKFAKEPRSKADCTYRLALYHFHMSGLERDQETPYSYAMTKVDPAYQSGFTTFMNMYLRLKYANGQLMSGDDSIINSFANSIRPSVRKRIGFFKMLFNYFNIFRAQRFFRRPIDSDALSAENLIDKIE